MPRKPSTLTREQLSAIRRTARLKYWEKIPKEQRRELTAAGVAAMQAAKKGVRT